MALLFSCSAFRKSKRWNCTKHKKILLAAFFFFFFACVFVHNIQWHSYLGVVWHYIFRMRIKVRRKWVEKLIILFVSLVCTLFYTVCECERVFAISMRKIGTFRVYRYHGNSNYPHRLRHRNKFSHAHQNFLISFTSFSGVRALFVLAKASFCVFRVFVLSCS